MTDKKTEIIDFEQDPNYERCIVSFLDILGFRHMVNTENAESISSKLHIFRHSAIPGGDEYEPAKRSDEVRLNSEVRLEIISDAVVRARTIETQSNTGPLTWELLDLLHIQMECILNGFLIRGALTIGYLNFGNSLNDPTFGPALIRAYDMEQKEVIYPRIAVEESVFDLLKNKNAFEQAHSGEADPFNVAKFLKTDDAGLHFIDYLEAGKTEFTDGLIDYIGFLRCHKTLIEKSLSDFCLPKVKRKYNWLKNYHNQQIDNDLASGGDKQIWKALRELRIS